MQVSENLLIGATTVFVQLHACYLKNIDIINPTTAIRILGNSIKC